MAILFTFASTILLLFVTHFLRKDLKALLEPKFFQPSFFQDSESKPLPADRRVMLGLVGTGIQHRSLQEHHICPISLFHSSCSWTNTSKKYKSVYTGMSFLADISGFCIFKKHLFLMLFISVCLEHCYNNSLLKTIPIPKPSCTSVVIRERYVQTGSLKLKPFIANIQLWTSVKVHVVSPQKQI